MTGVIPLDTNEKFGIPFVRCLDSFPDGRDIIKRNDFKDIWHKKTTPG